MRAWLLPPAERDAVGLGGFGKAVVRQVRRNTEARTFLLEAYTLCYAFTAGAFWSNPPSVVDDPWGLLRMAIPASAALLGLLLRNAYSTPRETSGPWPALIDALFATALALLSQEALARWAPQLALPHWAPTQGGIWGLEFLVVVRHLLPPPGRQPGQQRHAISSQELGWKLEEFQEKFGQLRKGHLIAAAILLPVSLALLCMGASATARAGAALVLAGALVLSMLMLRPPVPSGGYLNQVTGQRTRLQWIECWYFASLIPGIVLILWGSRVYSYLFLLPILLMATIVDLEAAKRTGAESR